MRRPGRCFGQPGDERRRASPGASSSRPRVEQDPGVEIPADQQDLRFAPAASPARASAEIIGGVDDQRGAVGARDPPAIAARLERDGCIRHHCRPSSVAAPANAWPQVAARERRAGNRAFGTTRSLERAGMMHVERTERPAAGRPRLARPSADGERRGARLARAGGDRGAGLAHRLALAARGAGGRRGRRHAGALARVKERLPRIDGAALDLVSTI